MKETLLKNSLRKENEKVEFVPHTVVSENKLIKKTYSRMKIRKITLQKKDYNTIISINLSQSMKNSYNSFLR